MKTPPIIIAGIVCSALACAVLQPPPAGECFWSATVEVWEDANGNGLRDPGEPPLPDVQVIVTRNGLTRSETRTGANGTASAGAISTTCDWENFQLNVAAPPGYTFTTASQFALSDLQKGGAVAIGLQPQATATPVATATIPPPSPTPDPFPDPVLKVVGEEEVVFDWTTDRCEREHIPDLPARAFRDAAGLVQLTTSHYVNYRMTGPDLNQVTPDCTVIMRSDSNEDPAMFNDHEWLAGLYTEDGQTIYALVHDEYQGHSHAGQCPTNDYFSCWYNTVTLAVSEDGGLSYHDAAPPPGHLVASLPIVYLPDEGPYGVFSPSNIIKGQDGFYYAFVAVIFHKTQDQWNCLMRTRDLADPRSWRYWNGEAFEGRFANPYTETISNRFDFVCEDIDWDNIGWSLGHSLTFNTALNRYALVGLSADQVDGRDVWGVYYSFSQDLIHWTRRKLLRELPLPWTVSNAGSDLSYLYPTLLDPDSPSRNFETTDETAYLYVTRHNFGQASLDRDLIRVPVEFFPSQAEAGP